VERETGDHLLNAVYVSVFDVNDPASVQRAFGKLPQLFDILSKTETLIKELEK
jgi:hypothetical protein